MGAVMGTEQYESDFLGLTEEAAVELARNLNIDLLIRRSDDEMIPLDRRVNRMTIEVRGGRVQVAAAG